MNSEKNNIRENKIPLKIFDGNIFISYKTDENTPQRLKLKN